MTVDYDSPYDGGPGEVRMLSTELQTPSPIGFGYDIEPSFSQVLSDVTADAPVDKLFLLTDETLYELYGREFHQRLQEDWPDVKLHLLPPGEQAKSFTNLALLCEAMMAQGANKRSVVVAFGGGSVGNIAGLVAGLLFRGIRFVEVPTSFTHQTDGCLSNKQAVNGQTGKNHFGMYHAPVLIWTDTRYLESEPATLKKAGIAEALKNALIDQSEFVPYLREHLDSACDHDSLELTDLAYKTILSKLEIIKQDPSEKQYGIVLEYGHTFAHAIEWLSNGRLIHGEAVAVGMKIAAELGLRLGLIDRELVDLHYELIDEHLGLTPELPERADADAILDAMRLDNKKIGKTIRYVLLSELGACANPDGDYLQAVDDALVKDVLEEFIAGYESRRALHAPKSLHRLASPISVRGESLGKRVS